MKKSFSRASLEMLLISERCNAVRSQKIRLARVVREPEGSDELKSVPQTAGFHRFSAYGEAPNRRCRHQAGFVITIELLLIVTILVLGSLVGLVAVRDALVKHYSDNQSQQAIVADANSNLLGKAVDFDEHDAPRIFYIDRTGGQAHRVLVGVRDDRFTAREPVYYSGSSCTGTPCVKSTSDEVADNTGVDGVSGSGSVSYFNALQGGPNYAVGRGAEGLPGHLFRESPLVCPVSPSEIGSRWMSQKVVAGEPCEAVNLEDWSTEKAYSECLVSTLTPCECPGSYDDESDVLATYLPLIDSTMTTTVASVNVILLPTGQQIAPIKVGTLCCPEAFSLQPDNLVNAVVNVAVTNAISKLDLSFSPVVQSALNDVLAPMAYDIECEAFIQLKAALSVPDPNDSSQNAFDAFQAPFWVNRPTGAGADSWRSVPPSFGEGG